MITNQVIQIVALKIRKKISEKNSRHWCCGADFLCKLYPPLSCYLCEKFQPYKNAPHTKILEELIHWRQNRLKQQGENDRIAQQLDGVIYHVAQVKAACEETEVLNEK